MTTDGVWAYRVEQLGDKRIQIVFRYSCHGSKANTPRKVRKIFRELKKALNKDIRKSWRQQ